jgi:hypothetical protein
LWRALWRSDQLDAAMQEEMRFHIEMEAERLVREQHLNPREARRQAYVAFRRRGAIRADCNGSTRSLSTAGSASHAR